MSMRPIIDKGEVAIDFPDKYDSVGFGRDCSFEARAEDDGVLIRLVRGGSDNRAAAIHLHHFLLAGMLEELARSLTERTPIDATHREPPAARSLTAALENTATQLPLGAIRIPVVGHAAHLAGGGLQKPAGWDSKRAPGHDAGTRPRYRC